MIVNIIKSCSVKLSGIVQSLHPGARLHLSDTKAQRLIEAGYAEQIKVDIEMYRHLTHELSKRDPKGGCWDWIVEHRHEQWREFMQAFICGAMTEARQRFDEMIVEWNNQLHQGKQPRRSGNGIEI